jgi:hypothetical protein
MRQFVLGALAAAAAGLGLAATEAQARFSPAPVDAPALVEEAACRTVRERIRRPNGRVVVRTVRRCGPGIRGPAWGPRRRVVKERTVRPNGRVVVRTVRRCR